MGAGRPIGAVRIESAAQTHVILRLDRNRDAWSERILAWRGRRFGVGVRTFPHL